MYRYLPCSLGSEYTLTLFMVCVSVLHFHWDYKDDIIAEKAYDSSITLYLIRPPPLQTFLQF